MTLELPVQDVVLQFTLLVTVAMLVKLAMQRLDLPDVIGLLIAGMLIGPGGFAVLPREPVAELMGQIGLVYIMFLAGMEVDLAIVRKQKSETASFGVLTFFCSLLPVAVLGLAFGYGWSAALLMGALLSSHTLLAYPMILRLQLLQRPAVITAVGGTVITDTAALILLAVVVQTAGESAGAWWTPLALLATLVALAWWFVPRLARRFFGRPRVGRAEKALFVLTVLVVLSTTAELIGTEAILGAFLAGLCVNGPLQERADLREHVEFVGRMLFIPFFFVSTGMLLHLSVFRGAGSVWLLAAALVALVLVGKFSAAWITGRMHGYTGQERVLMASLAVPQAAATLAVTLTAQEAGLFGIEEVDAVILVIFITCLLGPLLTQHVGRKLAAQT
jgi:Kef-type K+ transport system membrane component KefB